MKNVYEVSGISKQAFHQAKIRQSKTDQTIPEFFEQADKIRKEHSKAGCRKMALALSCRGWGRDKIEELLLDNGYRVRYPRRYTKTTDQRKEFFYPNLIEGLELNNINEVIQTDITYYRIKERHFYIVFLIDVYSRRIVGHSVSKTLRAQANIEALKKFLVLRKHCSLEKLIHHSDRGSQYIDKDYREMLANYGITPSMCKSGWQNAYAERINRTIKEEYLDGWEINDYATLNRKLGRAVNHYNSKRRHESLKMLSPIDFEKKVENLHANERPKMTIYKHLRSCSQSECE